MKPRFINETSHKLICDSNMQVIYMDVKVGIGVSASKEMLTGNATFLKYVFHVCIYTCSH